MTNYKARSHYKKSKLAKRNRVTANSKPRYLPTTTQVKTYSQSEDNYIDLKYNRAVNEILSIEEKDNTRTTSSLVTPKLTTNEVKNAQKIGSDSENDVKMFKQTHAHDAYNFLPTKRRKTVKLTFVTLYPEFEADAPTPKLRKRQTASNLRIQTLWHNEDDLDKEHPKYGIAINLNERHSKNERDGNFNKKHPKNEEDEILDKKRQKHNRHKGTNNKHSEIQRDGNFKRPNNETNLDLEKKHLENEEDELFDKKRVKNIRLRAINKKLSDRGGDESLSNKRTKSKRDRILITKLSRNEKDRSIDVKHRENEISEEVHKKHPNNKRNDDLDNKHKSNQRDKLDKNRLKNERYNDDRKERDHKKYLKKEIDDGLDNNLSNKEYEELNNESPRDEISKELINKRLREENGDIFDKSLKSPKKEKDERLNNVIMNDGRNEVFEKEHLRHQSDVDSGKKLSNTEENIISNKKRLRMERNGVDHKKRPKKERDVNLDKNLQQETSETEEITTELSILTELPAKATMSTYGKYKLHLRNSNVPMPSSPTSQQKKRMFPKTKDIESSTTPYYQPKGLQIVFTDTSNKFKWTSGYTTIPNDNISIQDSSEYNRDNTDRPSFTERKVPYENIYNSNTLDDDVTTNKNILTEIKDLKNELTVVKTQVLNHTNIIKHLKSKVRQKEEKREYESTENNDSFGRERNTEQPKIKKINTPKYVALKRLTNVDTGIETNNIENNGYKKKITNKIPDGSDMEVYTKKQMYRYTSNKKKEKIMEALKTSTKKKYNFEPTELPKEKENTDFNSYSQNEIIYDFDSNKLKQNKNGHYDEEKYLTNIEINNQPAVKKEKVSGNSIRNKMYGNEDNTKMSISVDKSLKKQIKGHRTTNLRDKMYKNTSNIDGDNHNADRDIFKKHFKIKDGTKPYDLSKSLKVTDIGRLIDDEEMAYISSISAVTATSKTYNSKTKQEKGINHIYYKHSIKNKLVMDNPAITVNGRKKYVEKHMKNDLYNDMKRNNLKDKSSLNRGNKGVRTKGTVTKFHKHKNGTKREKKYDTDTEKLIKSFKQEIYNYGKNITKHKAVTETKKPSVNPNGINDKILQETEISQGQKYETNHTTTVGPHISTKVVRNNNRFYLVGRSNDFDKPNTKRYAHPQFELKGNMVYKTNSITTKIYKENKSIKPNKEVKDSFIRGAASQIMSTVDNKYDKGNYADSNTNTQDDNKKYVFDKNKPSHDIDKKFKSVSNENLDIQNKMKAKRFSTIKYIDDKPTSNRNDDKMQEKRMFITGKQDSEKEIYHDTNFDEFELKRNAIRDSFIRNNDEDHFEKYSERNPDQAINYTANNVKIMSQRRFNEDETNKKKQYIDNDIFDTISTTVKSISIENKNLENTEDNFDIKNDRDLINHSNMVFALSKSDPDTTIQAKRSVTSTVTPDNTKDIPANAFSKHITRTTSNPTTAPQIILPKSVKSLYVKDPLNKYEELNSSYLSSHSKIMLMTRKATIIEHKSRDTDNVPIAEDPEELNTDNAEINNSKPLQTINFRSVGTFTKLFDPITPKVEMRREDQGVLKEEVESMDFLMSGRRNIDHNKTMLESNSSGYLSNNMAVND